MTTSDGALSAPGSLAVRGRDVGPVAPALLLRAGAPWARGVRSDPPAARRRLRRWAARAVRGGAVYGGRHRGRGGGGVGPSARGRPLGVPADVGGGDRRVCVPGGAVAEG